MAKESSAVTLDIGNLEAAAKEIQEIDTKISAATGSEAAIKKATAERLATENADRVDSIVSQVVDQLRNVDVPTLVGLVDKLNDAVEDEFSTQIDEFLKAEVDKQTAGSKEDVSKLREDRKAKVEAFRALKTILETFGTDTSSVPEPKRSAGRGGSGAGAAKTGLNKERYRFKMDGNDRPNSQNTLSSMAYYATLGCAGTEEEPERWGTAQLRKFLEDNGVKYGEQDEWEVTLPNGTKIGARRMTADEVAELESKAKESENGEKTESEPAEASA